MANTEIYLVDLIDLSYVFIQTVPRELELSPDSQFEVILSPGRNNPFYQFKGSEDTLTLDLDWYCNEETRKAVLEKCRWIESLTKADGYQGGIRPVKLVFGDIFPPGVSWQIQSAKYTLSMFDRVYGLLPCQAYQKLILKRLADHNRTTSEIRNGSDLLNPPTIQNSTVR